MNARYDILMAELWARCREFNDAAPVGTPVVYDAGAGLVETIVVAPACVLACKARVMIEGKSDSVPLDRLERVITEAH